MKKDIGVLITGTLIGLTALLLAAAGNPGNMGFCIACFLRDTAGAMKLHSAAAVQYFRPETVGIVLGSLLVAVIKKEFRARGGSSPVTRFALGFAVMVGALMFLGCPLRMIIRLGGGDLNAVLGLLGFAAGIAVGAFTLKKGFTLKRAYPQHKLEGMLFPTLFAVAMALSVMAPLLFSWSAEGPGSKHAPVLLALLCGAAAGALAQRSRFCMAGGIRDALMFKDFHLLYGTAALLAVVLIGNLFMGSLSIGFAGQPVAHTDGVWNFLGMALVGWGSVLLGGCPLRQLVLAGEGNSDSAVTVLGFMAGAAFCHNFGLASSAEGPTLNGMIAVIAGFVLTAAVTLMNIERDEA